MEWQEEDEYNAVVPKRYIMVAEGSPSFPIIYYRSQNFLSSKLLYYFLKLALTWRLNAYIVWQEFFIRVFENRLVSLLTYLMPLEKKDLIQVIRFTIVTTMTITVKSLIV